MENKQCDKCGLLPQTPVESKACGCQAKKCKCKKDKCCDSGLTKVTVPATLGDETTGQDKPENGAYVNAIVTYEASGSQFIYDKNGAFTPLVGRGSTGDMEFNDILHRPKYAGQMMTNATDIPDVKIAVEAESSARSSADNELQDQIDALAVASDVTDVVGTYADLQAYDTSKLKDNDIVKVLQDETHNDQTTYYRWSKASEQFTLIGSEGPYYTKVSADEKFQEKLTAGTNVQINNNVVSATDTTYSAGSGLDLSGTEFSADTAVLATVNYVDTAIAGAGVDTISSEDWSALWQ